LTIGQRQLVEVARLLARDARVLILDEPTATLSDADIERILGILKVLRSQGRSIIYITHRLGEVFSLCDSVTVLRNGQHVATQPVSAVTRAQLVEMMLGRSTLRTRCMIFPWSRHAAGSSASPVRSDQAPTWSRVRLQGWSRRPPAK
jgi:ABC-type sugar transport system ATPase subunit